jgi:DNA segregation ATPase FtsK/SpoIIIE, S-DNA-T family
MSGVLGYLAARSLRDPPATPGEEQRPPSPSVRPRVPSFYEAMEDRQPAHNPVGFVEEQTEIEQEPTAPSAAASSTSPIPAPSRRARGPTAAPHPTPATPPPLHQDSKADTAPAEEPAPAGSRERRPRHADQKVTPLPVERSVSTDAPFRDQAADAQRSLDRARIPPPAPGQVRVPSRAAPVSAAAEHSPAPRAEPHPVVRPREYSDANSAKESTETPVPRLVPRHDTPLEALRQPEPPMPARHEPAAPRIRVSIGRIEIRAAYPAPPAPPVPRPAPAMSLDDYLAKRERAGGGT